MVLLFKASYLIYIIDSLMLNSQPTVLLTQQLMPEQSSSHRHPGFPHRANHNFPAGILDSTLALYLGVILNSKITNKNVKKTCQE